MAPGRGGRGARAGRGSGGGGKDSTAQLHAFFERVIGPQRWRTQLLPALTRETSHVALLNAFQATDAAALAEQQGLQPFFAHGALHAFRRVQDAGPYAPPPNDPTTGLRTHYWLDAASLVPALLLEPRPGCKVLDMCAAPGGKTLALAMQMFPGRQGAPAPPAPAPAPVAPPVQGPTLLVANEMDRARCTRLEGVLGEHLPGVLRATTDLLQPVRTTCQPADRYWQRNEAEVYDRVLLDVPCSSDRHVLQRAALQPRAGVPAGEWSEAGCKRLADLQLQLLLAGLRALAPGGRLVYSTCSMAPVENDQVVDRALARFPPGAVTVHHPLQPPPPAAATDPAQPDGAPRGGGAAAAASLPLSPETLQRVFDAEPTQHGLLILPDRVQAGPMYVAVLHKHASVQGSLTAAARLGFQMLAPGSDDEEDDEDDEEEEGAGEDGPDAAAPDAAVPADGTAAEQRAALAGSDAAG